MALAFGAAGPPDEYNPDPANASHYYKRLRSGLERLRVQEERDLLGRPSDYWISERDRLKMEIDAYRAEIDVLRGLKDASRLEDLTKAGRDSRAIADGFALQAGGKIGLTLEMDPDWKVWKQGERQVQQKLAEERLRDSEGFVDFEGLEQDGARIKAQLAARATGETLEGRMAGVSAQRLMDEEQVRGDVGPACRRNRSHGRGAGTGGRGAGVSAQQVSWTRSRYGWTWGRRVGATSHGRGAGRDGRGATGTGRKFASQIHLICGGSSS